MPHLKNTGAVSILAVRNAVYSHELCPVYKRMYIYNYFSQLHSQEVNMNRGKTGLEFFPETHKMFTESICHCRQFSQL